MRRAAALAVLAAGALALGGCGSARQRTAATGSDDQISELRSIDQLRTAFNAHPDVPRLIVLVSPT